MPSSILAEANTAANSSEVTIVAGTPQTIGAFRTGELELDGTDHAVITRKDAVGEFQPTGLQIDRTHHDIVLYGPGVYRAERPVGNSGFGLIVD